jgi:hypothetical protein
MSNQCGLVGDNRDASGHLPPRSGPSRAISIFDGIGQDALVSYLRDPSLDPEYALKPAELVAIEVRAEPMRKAFSRLGSRERAVVRAFIEAELDAARRRAVAVGDDVLVECLGEVAQRLLSPGEALASARASARIEELFDGGARLRLVPGGS